MMEAKRFACGAGRPGEGPGREVVVHGVRLAYDDQGSGPVLLCLHAVGHGARDFARVREHFSGQQRVIALDWPGQGRSGVDRVPASAVRYAELLAGFVSALRLDELVVLGNSIGGAAAIQFASAEQERVRGLVLVDSGGLDAVDRLARFVTGRMAAFFAAGARGARWFPWAFRRFYGVVLPRPAAREQRERIIAAAREVAPILAEAWRSFGAEAADLRRLAAALECPVLVVWAKQDRVLQLGRSRPAIERIPNVRLELFPGGHSAFLECPEAFESSLESFLAEISGTANAKIRQRVAHPWDSV